MAEVSLSTVVTPEGLDKMYPVPSWATGALGGQGKRKRFGWGRTHAGGFSRVVEWRHRHVTLTVLEVCDDAGVFMAASDPVVDFDHKINVKNESDNYGARQVITEYTEDLQAAWLHLLPAESYVATMEKLALGTVAQTTPDGTEDGDLS